MEEPMMDPVTYALNGVAIIGAGAFLFGLLCVLGLALIQRRKGRARGPTPGTRS